MRLKKWNIKNDTVIYSNCYCNTKPVVDENTEVSFVKEETLFMCILRYWKRFFSFIRFVLVQSCCIVSVVFAVKGWMDLETSVNVLDYSLYKLVDFISLLYLCWCVFSVGIDIVKNTFNDTNSFLNDRQLRLIITILMLEITKLFIKGKKLTISNIFKCGFYSFFTGIICCLILLAIFIIKFAVEYSFGEIETME